MTVLYTGAGWACSSRCPVNQQLVLPTEAGSLFVSTLTDGRFHLVALGGVLSLTKEEKAPRKRRHPMNKEILFYNYSNVVNRRVYVVFFLGLYNFLFKIILPLHFLLISPLLCLYKVISIHSKVRCLCFSYSSCIFPSWSFKVKHTRLYFCFLTLLYVCNVVLKLIVIF